jgi:hypothetical protein
MNANPLKFAIADPPYLGRAERWYGETGCGIARGHGRADQHPEAHIWDDPQSHIDLVHRLNRDYHGWAIAMSVNSLSVYLSAVETDSRNGIRVCVWHKPSAVTSGSRITNHWEPVLINVPKERRSWKSGNKCSDVFSCNPNRRGFIGSKPHAWTFWILELLGVQEGDSVDDLFPGSGAVAEAMHILAQGLPIQEGLFE